MGYQNSNIQFERAVKSIPTGSQTFSKSHYSVPKGGAPLFIEKGLGDEVWDIDGNKYTDLVNGLLSVSIGYCNPVVDEAIKTQLKQGINFSLPHRLESEVAEKLIEIIPSAEMVRFGKSGTDATSAAVRLARAYTGKKRIAICGYHGWQDWYIGTTKRNLGVPEEVSGLSSIFFYNDIKSLEQLFIEYDDIAAVILEPMAAVFPEVGFLEGVRNLCNSNNAVLIFDEMITGFRLDIGGAQSLFNVIPDISTFGKGMANGMPISAVVGKKEIMMLMDDIFFSGTFGGETLSLAAANCVIGMYMDLPIIKHLSDMGEKLTNGFDKLRIKYGVNYVNLIGHNSWKVLNIDHRDDNLIKSILIEILASEGVLTIGSHNISYSTNNESIDNVLKAYECLFQKIGNAQDDSQLLSLLKGEQIKPVFKVR